MVACDLMQVYWDGTADAFLAPVVSTPVQTVFTDFNVDVMTPWRPKGFKALARLFFGANIGTIHQALGDSVFVFQAVNIEKAESVVDPFLGGSAPGDFALLVKPVIDIAEYGSYVAQDASMLVQQYEQTLTLPALSAAPNEARSAAEVVRLVKANSNLAMCA